MVQWVKEPVAKADNLNLIPRTDMVEERKKEEKRKRKKYTGGWEAFMHLDLTLPIYRERLMTLSNNTATFKHLTPYANLHRSWESLPPSSLGW